MERFGSAGLTPSCIGPKSWAHSRASRANLRCKKAPSCVGAWSRLVDALIVVDMQVGPLSGAPKHDLQGVVDRIGALSQKVRSEGDKVIWIRHCGNGADGFERRTPGWAFLPNLLRNDKDIVVEKTLNDPYVGTALSDTLGSIAAPPRPCDGLGDGLLR